MVARPFRSRKPKSSPLWKCCHAHFDHFTAAYPRDYQSRYGVLRRVIPEVVDKFMQCGDFAKGFARVRCDECSHEYLLAFSCKGRVAVSGNFERGQLVIEPWLDDSMPDDDCEL